jgi:hypothetical protein
MPWQLQLLFFFGNLDVVRHRLDGSSSLAIIGDVPSSRRTKSL